MKRSTGKIVLCCSVLAAASCSVQYQQPVFPEMDSDQVSVWTVEGVAFDNGDFSGLAFNSKGDRMIAAFNSAALYWLDIPEEGKPLHFVPFEVEGSGFHTEKRDCESVTLDGRTGDIYYAQERDAKNFKGASVYRIAAPDYEREELVISFDSDTVPDGNTGLEGLAWYGDDKFIAGKEGNRRANNDPLLIYWSESEGVTAKLAPAPMIKQIAEVVYDDVRGCLWMLDGDHDHVLYRCDMRGGILNRFPLPKQIKNAEALLLDREKSCIWIGSDEVPSKLYKVGFRNL